MGAIDKAVGGLGEGLSEEGPRHQGAVYKEWVRSPIGGQPGEMAKDDRKDQHHEQRLQYRPEHPEKGLFVAHLDVAPHEEVEKPAIAPQAAQIEGCPAGAGPDCHARAMLTLRP